MDLKAPSMRTRKSAVFGRASKRKATCYGPAVLLDFEKLR